MRRKIFTLLVALLAIATGVQAADEITSLKLTIKYNGGEAMTQEFPASGFDVVDLTDKSTTSLIIQKAEVLTSGSVSGVTFTAALYRNSPSADQWQNIPLENKGNGRWELDMGEGVELIEDHMDGETRTFEFFVDAKNASNADIYYNNGGQNYKVLYHVGGDAADWKVKYYKAETATIDLTVNNEAKHYTYNGDGVRTQFYGEQPGEVSSLAINGFSTWFIYNQEKGVTIDEVSLQYRINVDGTEGEWNALAANQTDSWNIWNEDKEQTDHGLEYSASGLNVDVINGLATGHSYVLELMYQVKTADGYYRMLKGDDLCLSFTVAEGNGIDNVSQASSSEKTRYNLSGQQVTRTMKGVHIVNGKKVVVK